MRDESGRKVPNPISLVSQWKILDNLRRSLVEPATFLLLVFGWLVLPGNPLYWTLATIGILFVPAWFQFAFNLIKAAVERKPEVDQRCAVCLDYDQRRHILHALFLASPDVAVARRSGAHAGPTTGYATSSAGMGDRGRDGTEHTQTYSGRHLSRVDSRAGPRIGCSRSSLAGVRLFTPRYRFLLWGCSKWISMWLNLASAVDPELKRPTRMNCFSRSAALRTWRYFAEFSTAEHNWLIPDNVQEEPAAVAGRMSPTNLGFLLNARQVACEFGFLTVPEFAEQTLRTLATVAKLPRSHGHLLNWYDTRTLQPLAATVRFFGGQRESGGITVDLAAGMSGSFASPAAGTATGGRFGRSSPYSGRPACLSPQAVQGI